MDSRKHLHFGLRLSFLSLLSLAACGDSGSAETSAGPTTAATTAATETGTSTGNTTGTGTNPSTGPTSGSAGQTDSGTTTGTSATGSTSASTGTTETGTSDNTSSTGGTTGAEEFIPCETEKDCVLADGCCECEPVHINEAPHACDVMECLTNVCAIYGLEGAPVECRFGRCTFAKVPCNPLGITCKSLPPVCPVDQVPGVLEDDNGKCWSGFCVPAEACDWVPDCAACADEELVCVGKLQKGAYHLCEPRPASCEGSGDIDCGCGQQICEGSPPHTVCHDEDPDIACECPFC
jgi:hypothetical protein